MPCMIDCAYLITLEILRLVSNMDAHYKHFIND